MENILKKLTNKQNLNFDESKGTFEQIMTGQINEEHVYKCKECNTSWDKNTRYCNRCKDVAMYCSCYEDLI